jgi:hypothetical protein
VALHTGIAVSNLDTQPATIRFTAFDGDGVPLIGAAISNPLSILLNPGEQLPVVESQLFGRELPDAASTRVESTSAQVIGFYLMFNEGMTELDGAPMLSNAVNRFVFPTIEDGGPLSVCLVNPNPGSAELQMSLLHADGVARDWAHRSVKVNGTLSEPFSGLFPKAVPDPGDYLLISSTRAAVPFAFMEKPGGYLEAQRGLDATMGGPAIYAPEYVSGAGWRSTISIVNLDPFPGNVTIKLLGDDGKQIGKSVVLRLTGNGKAVIEDPGFFAETSDGMVRGSVEIAGSGVNLTGSIAIGDSERRRFAAALPLVSPQRSVSFGQVASSDTFFTGIAILNPGTGDAKVTLELYRADGTLEGTFERVIPPRQRISKLLTELFPTLVGRNRNSGYVRLESDYAVASIAVAGAVDLSSLYAVPGREIPPSP